MSVNPNKIVKYYLNITNIVPLYDTVLSKVSIKKSMSKEQIEQYYSYDFYKSTLHNMLEEIGKTTYRDNGNVITNCNKKHLVNAQLLEARMIELAVQIVDRITVNGKKGNTFSSADSDVDSEYEDDLD